MQNYVDETSDLFHSLVMQTKTYGENATEKQVNYALMLLSQKGYSTRYMDASFKRLGASMRERSGSVRDWVGNMSVVECSKLIDKLK